MGSSCRSSKTRREFGFTSKPSTPRRCGSFKQATYSNPKDADGYYNIAATYHRMGRQEHCESDLKQAEKFYNDCLDRNPNHTECYRGLAVLLAERGDKDAAFRLVQGWADREPKSADAKVELARLYDEFGNRQAAQDCLYEAIEAQPDNARALTALAKMRDDAGDKAQALANYQRSLESRQPAAVRGLANQRVAGRRHGSDVHGLGRRRAPALRPRRSSKWALAWPTAPRRR